MTIPLQAPQTPSLLLPSALSVPTPPPALWKEGNLSPFGDLCPSHCLLSETCCPHSTQFPEMSLTQPQVVLSLFSSVSPCLFSQHLLLPEAILPVLLWFPPPHTTLVIQVPGNQEVSLSYSGVPPAPAAVPSSGFRGSQGKPIARGALGLSQGPRVKVAAGRAGPPTRVSPLNPEVKPRWGSSPSCQRSFRATQPGQRRGSVPRPAVAT